MQEWTQIEDWIGHVMVRYPVPGAAVMICTETDQRVWVKGHCSIGQGDEPVSEATRFQIASCAKAYTAMLVAALASRGELGWYDPVNRHLPEFSLDDATTSDACNLSDLLGMRLGLRNEGPLNWGRNAELGLEFLLNRIPYAQRFAPHGAAFSYFNPAYSLIAAIIEKRTGLTFESALQSLILEPLGLKDVLFQEGRVHRPRNLAMPHVLLHGELKPLGEARCGGRVGESCLYMSARDTALWLRCNLEGHRASDLVGRSSSAEKIYSPQIMGAAPQGLGVEALGYAMGWQVRQTAGAQLLVHEGVEFGASAFAVLDRQRRVAIAVHTNVNQPILTQGIALGAHSVIAGGVAQEKLALIEKFDAASQQAIGAQVAAVCHDQGRHLSATDIIGRYFNPAQGMIEVSDHGAGLEMCVLDGWVYDAVLAPVGGGAFSATCRYPGMESLLKRRGRVRFDVDRGPPRLIAPGLGVFMRVE